VTTTRAVIGWDVGGVHLKAARAEDGRIVAAAQIAAPLRGGLDALVAAFAAAKTRMAATVADRHVVTMTAELADTFISRAEGVQRVAELAARELAGAPVSLYAGPAGWIEPADAAHHVREIASANWHAAAALVARNRGDALLVDIGSTTTDLVPIRHGAVAAAGYTDAERLTAGELVYTGLVRSFVMAIAERAPFRGAWTWLVNENFATMADVHRLLGNLPTDADLMPTADGREKTPAASRARLARMVGCDASDAAEADWTALAQWFAEAQLRQIADAAMLVASRTPLDAAVPVVGAGIGGRVAEQLAHRLARDYVAFDTLLDVAAHARADARCCAPAAALALLGSA
jgi:probable H4MPT-linked C1 transfer pathway protein